MIKPGKQHKLREWMDKIQAENKTLKDSRDSILKSLRTILNLPAAKIHWETIEEIAEKAQALKEKPNE